jgi:hypothetical protein
MYGGISMKKVMVKTVIPILLVLAAATFVSAELSIFKSDYLVKEPITRDRLKFLPVPEDFRNYFLIQSINDNTKIIIGDFVGTQKKICLIVDNGYDGKIDSVIEYYPEDNKYTVVMKPTTTFYTGYDDVKKQIITGTIFKNNYAYNMNSIDILKGLLERGRDIYRYEHGYSVKVYDPDKPTTIISEFFFGKKNDRYDLIFATYAYKVFHTNIQPSIFYSVYCRNTKDPMISSVVESLLKMVPKG